MPQHLRVLGGPRGDLPHRRLAVHAPLRLLPDRHRQARRLRRRRAASRRRVGRAHAAALLDRHRRRPRRPARRGRVALRRDDPPDPPPVPGHRRRDPRARLLGQPRPPRRGVLGAARGVRAQRRDGAAHLQAHPPGVPLRALARRDHAGPRRRADHQVEPHPRHGRGARGGLAGAPATCTTPAPTSSRSPSTCGRARDTSRSTAGCAPRSSSSSRPRPRRSASSACSPGRSCARRTAPDASGPSRCTPRDVRFPTSSRTSPTRRSGSRRRSDDRTAVRLGTRVLARSETAPRAGILDTMARTKDASKAQKEPGRLKQMWQVFQMTRRYDPKSQWLMLARLPRARAHRASVSRSGFSEGNGFTIALWVDRRRARRSAARPRRARPSRRAGRLLADRGPARCGRRGAAQRPARRLGRQRDARRRQRQDPGRHLPRRGPRRRRAHQRGPASRARSACSTTSCARCTACCPNVPITLISVGPDEGSIELHRLSGARSARRSARSPSPRCSRCRTA